MVRPWGSWKHLVGVNDAAEVQAGTSGSLTSDAADGEEEGKIGERSRRPMDRTR